MKNKLFFILAILLLLSCTACNNTDLRNSVATDTAESLTEGIGKDAKFNADEIKTMFLPDSEFKRILDENGSGVLNLPNTDGKIRIFVSEEEEKYLPRINEQLYLTAVQKVMDSRGNDDSPHFEISIDVEGYVYLYGEVIVTIDPPNSYVSSNGETISEGCGIDHDHLYFRERISAEPVIEDGN